MNGLFGFGVVLALLACSSFIAAAAAIPVPPKEKLSRTEVNYITFESRLGFGKLLLVIICVQMLKEMLTLTKLNVENLRIFFAPSSTILF
jgi:hypothetical protein